MHQPVPNQSPYYHQQGATDSCLNLFTLESNICGKWISHQIAIIHETNDNTCFVNKNYVNRIFNNKI